MASSTDRIKTLLGNGMSNDVVANAVGVSPSYISQLMSDEQFHRDVVDLRVKNHSQVTERDRSWDGIEDSLLTKLTEIIPYMTRPNDILNALKTANAAKRRSVQSQEAMAQTAQVVTLNMPVKVIHNYVTNSRNEVVEVDGQTLVTMPAAVLMQKLLEARPESKSYEQVRKLIHTPPGTSDPA